MFYFFITLSQDSLLDFFHHEKNCCRIFYCRFSKHSYGKIFYFKYGNEACWVFNIHVQIYGCFLLVFFSFSTQIHIHDPHTPHYSQPRLKKSELKIIHDKVLLHITSLQGRMSILSIFFS